MSARYFYQDPSTRGRAGPVTVDLLKGLLDAGEIDATTLVWTSGMPNWEPIGKVDYFVTKLEADLLRLQVRQTPRGPASSRVGSASASPSAPASVASAAPSPVPMSRSALAALARLERSWFFLDEEGTTHGPIARRDLIQVVRMAESWLTPVWHESMGRDGQSGSFGRPKFVDVFPDHVGPLASRDEAAPIAQTQPGGIEAPTQADAVGSIPSRNAREPAASPSVPVAAPAAAPSPAARNLFAMYTKASETGVVAPSERQEGAVGGMGGMGEGAGNAKGKDGNRVETGADEPSSAPPSVVASDSDAASDASLVVGSESDAEEAVPSPSPSPSPSSEEGKEVERGERGETGGRVEEEEREVGVLQGAISKLEDELRAVKQRMGEGSVPEEEEEEEEGEEGEEGEEEGSSSDGDAMAGDAFKDALGGMLQEAEAALEPSPAPPARDPPAAPSPGEPKSAFRPLPLFSAADLADAEFSDDFIAHLVSFQRQALEFRHAAYGGS